MKADALDQASPVGDEDPHTRDFWPVEAAFHSKQVRTPERPETWRGRAVGLAGDLNKGVQKLLGEASASTRFGMGRLITWLTKVALALALDAVSFSPAVAWGDKGHEIIALIAQAHLDPSVRRQVSAMLAADTDTLTKHDIAAAATWADKLRNSHEVGARQRTRQWHFVDIEVDAPNLDQACFGHPPIPPGVAASNGPARDCVVDKIQEFAAELASPATNPEERIVALKFLLHFVGDVHQPLHASDAHDRGGNDKRVSAVGLKAGNLHHFWDTVFVEQLGPNPRSVAAGLDEHISNGDVQAWSQGDALIWATEHATEGFEAFKMGKDDAYGQLPEPGVRGSFRLSDRYITMATQDVALQLSKAGVRLAFVLNKAFGSNVSR